MNDGNVGVRPDTVICNFGEYDKVHLVFNIPVRTAAMHTRLPACVYAQLQRCVGSARLTIHSVFSPAVLMHVITSICTHNIARGRRMRNITATLAFAAVHALTVYNITDTPCWQIMLEELGPT